jgi:hypothetical protein
MTRTTRKAMPLVLAALQELDHLWPHWHSKTAIAKHAGLTVDRTKKALAHLAMQGLARRDIVDRDKVIEEAWRFARPAVAVK